MKINTDTASVSASGVLPTRAPSLSIRMKTDVTPEHVLQAAPSPVSEAGAAAAAAPNESANLAAATTRPQAEAVAPSTIPASTGTAEPTAEATQPLSPQYAALARQRRALQVKERELADREKALATQSTGTDSVALARLKSEPLQVLLDAGVSYEQLTEAVLSGQGSSEIHALKAELADLKEGVNKQLTDRDQQARTQVVAQMQREGERLVDQAEDFELIKTSGQAKKYTRDAVKIVERIFDETGDVIDVSEALKFVESALYEDSLKLAKSKKVQSALTPPAPQTAPAPAVQAPAPPQQPQRQMHTLTNRDTAVAPVSRKARAMAAFYGQLNK